MQPTGIGYTELLVLICLIGGVGVLGSILWIWMLVDCATKEPNEGNVKIVWILVIALTHFIGALLYLFVRRPQRIAEEGQ